jgi:hypothetical protein
MHELTGPQRWLISVGAPLNKRNGRRLDRLGGDGRPTISWEASAVLRNGWQVRTSEDVVRTVSWLLGGGHRAEYEQAGLGTAREFAGWDAQRVANVAGWAYAAYLVDLESAWAWHRQAGALVRESFTSWADYGASYLAGLASWCEGEREVLDPSEQAMAWLLNDPSSPWLTLPFDLDLGDTPAPDLAPIEVVVGQANTPTIADAIQLAGPDGRVLVPAGTYREVIAPTHGIEIVAQGEVTVESAHVPCVRIEKMVGARLHGITLRSQLTADGKSLNAVHVNRGYVRMEACDVAASHDGVRVVTWGSAHVVDSTFHDCGSNGLNLVSGQLIAERCTVQRSAQNGIELQGEAGALVDECSIEDSGAASVLAHGKVRATLRRSSFTRNAGSASVVGIGSSDLVIDEVSIAGSQSGGIFFQETASAAISRTRITGCKLAALDVATTEPIQADEITATGNASAGVLVRNRAKLLLRGSQLEDSAEGHVWVLDTGILAMADCRLARGALGLWVQEGGAAVVHASRFEHHTGIAVDVQPRSNVELSFVHIEHAGGDGALVGEGASLRMSASTVNGAGGAGVRVDTTGSAVLESVTLTGCAGGEVVGDATRTESELSTEDQAAEAARAFTRAVRGRLIG